MRGQHSRLSENNSEDQLNTEHTANTLSYIYARLKLEALRCPKVDPLPGAVPKLRRVVRLHNSILMGESGEGLGH